MQAEDQEIFKQLATDISKTFALDVYEPDYTREIFFDDFKNKLAELISELIEKDYNRLMAILYRIDVSETEVRNCLEGTAIFNVADCLAEKIINRLIQKIRYRMGRTQG